MNPRHENEIKRLQRIAGQVGGIRKMVEEGRYCIDIAMQIKAARSALERVGLSILERHMRTCVANAIRSGKKASIDEKIGEVMRLVEGRAGA